MLSRITKVRRRPTSNWFNRSRNLVPGLTSGIVKDVLVSAGATSAPANAPQLQSVGYLVALLTVQDANFKGSGSPCQVMLASNFHHKGTFPATLNSLRNGIRPRSSQ